MKAFVGLNKLSDIKIIGNEVDNEEQDIKEVTVGKIILHPDYDCSKRGDNDIGKFWNQIITSITLKLSSITLKLFCNSNHKLNSAIMFVLYAWQMIMKKTLKMNLQL